MKTKHWLPMQVVKAIFFALMIAVNYLAGTNILNGYTTKDVSDRFPNLFTPAGFTFSIWGLIYLSLLVWLVMGFVRHGTSEAIMPAATSRKIDLLFLATCVLNAVWLLAWQYLMIPLSVVLMLALLVVLIMINLTLSKIPFSGANSLIYRFPFAIYFGWITVATIANITVLLVSIGWDGFGIAPEYWTAIILVVSLVIVITTMFRLHCIPYALVPLWAYYGILSNHLSPLVFDGNYPVVIYTLFACMGILTIAIVVELFRILSKKN